MTDRQVNIIAADLVDAALAGFDQRELETLPSLPDVNDFVRIASRPHAISKRLKLSRCA